LTRRFEAPDKQNNDHHPHSLPLGQNEKPTASTPNMTPLDAIQSQTRNDTGSAIEAERLLDEMLEKGQIELIAFNSALNAAAKCEDGSADMAERIFAKIEDHGLQPSSISYHSLLDAHAHAENGSATRALQLLEQMIDEKETPELSTFTTVLSMQGRIIDGSARAALKVLSMLPRAGLRANTIVVNAAIDAQAKAADGSAATAIALVNKMSESPDLDLRPSIVTFTTAIDACGKCSDGSAEDAAALLEKMVAQGLVPNALTFGVLVAVAARKGTANAASDVLVKMAKLGVPTNLVAFNSALDAQSKRDGGSAKAARALLEQMKQTTDPEMLPNIVSYTAAIAAEARCADGSADHGAMLFDEALELGLRPDIITLTTLLDTLAKKGGDASRAVEILDKMNELDFLIPNRIHYNVVINACATSRPALVVEAERVLKMMLRAGFDPTAHTLSALLRATAFAAKPRPDLARRWFMDFAGSVELNDFVVRALRSALPHSESTKLLAKVTQRQTAPDCVDLLAGAPWPASSGFLQQRRSDSRRNSNNTWRDQTVPTPPTSGSSSGSSGDERDNRTSPPMVRRRSSRMSLQQRRSSGSLGALGAMFVPPADHPVSGDSRRNSFHSGRRGSLSGLFAENAEAQAQPPEAYAALGAVVRRASSTSLSRRGSAVNLSPVPPPPPPLARRMSLKDRVAALRSEAKGSEPLQPQNESKSPNNECTSPENESVGPEKESVSPMGTPDQPKDMASTLLTPEYFAQSLTPPASPTLSRACIMRRPSGPDGTVGFGERRRSSSLHALVT